jgi:hypothetical protein
MCSDTNSKYAEWELELPLHRVAHQLGVTCDLLGLSAELIERETFFTARGWLRLLQEQLRLSQQPERHWHLRKQQDFLISLCNSSGFSESEHNTLQALLDYLPAPPVQSAA